MKRAQAPKVGFAKVKVTDAGDLGTHGVHDDLYARLLYLHSSDGPSLVISLDDMGLTPGRSIAVKSRLAKACGIPSHRTAIFYSHTHSGMDFKAAPLARLLARGARQARKEAVPAKVAYRRVDVGHRYSVNRRAQVGHGLGVVSIIFNRNLAVDLKKGREEAGAQVRDFILNRNNIWGTTYLNPELDAKWPDRPLSRKQAALLQRLPSKISLDGPVDPHLEWLGFRTPRGRWLGSIIRFSAHSAVWRKAMTNMISADYPGVFAGAVEQATGDAPALFVNGPCGNLKPLYTVNDEAEMNRVGASLARELLRGHAALRWRPLERVLFACRKESFPVHADVRKYAGRWPVAKAAARFTALARRGDDPAAMKAALDWNLRCWGNDDASASWRRPTISLPFHLIAFNDIGLVGLPTEVWCEIGLAVKKACQGKRLLVGSLCDVATNYVPTPGALPLGGYEAVNSMLEESAGDRFAAIGAALVEEHL